MENEEILLEKNVAGSHQIGVWEQFTILGNPAAGLSKQSSSSWALQQGPEMVQKHADFPLTDFYKKCNSRKQFLEAQFLAILGTL